MKGSRNILDHSVHMKVKKTVPFHEAQCNFTFTALDMRVPCAAQLVSLLILVYLLNGLSLPQVMASSHVMVLAGR